MDDTSRTRSDFEKRIDLRQDPRYIDFVKEIGFESVKIPTESGMVWGLLRYLPIVKLGFLKVQRYGGKIDKDQLRDITRQRRVIRTILEPINQGSIPSDLSLDSDPFLPTKTRVLKIRGFESELSVNVKRIITKKSTIKSEEVDTEMFFEAWKKYSKIWTISRNSLHALKKSFGRDCLLWVEKDNDEIVGGILCTVSNGWGYYYSAFVSSRGRELNAGVIGTYNLLTELRKREVSYFDFDGVFDPRFPKKSWLGFSEFKSRFGGVEIELPGCYSRWF